MVVSFFVSSVVGLYDTPCCPIPLPHHLVKHKMGVILHICIFCGSFRYRRWYGGNSEVRYKVVILCDSDRSIYTNQAVGWHRVKNITPNMSEATHQSDLFMVIITKSSSCTNR